MLALNGCEKNPQIDDSIMVLLSELRSFTNDVVSPVLLSPPCNPDNYYEGWGEAMYYGVLNAFNEEQKTRLSIIDMESKIEKTIPQEYLIMDTLGVNLKKTMLIFDEFLLVYINKSLIEALQISSKMESYISKTRLINDFDKGYLLKMISVLKYSTYFGVLKSSKSGKGSFEKCWKRKLQSVNDSGFFERNSCILSWPFCFAYLAADCVIEEIAN